MSRAFDIVVFGASGYTGQYVVELLAKFAAGDSIAWTVAGRSRSKLLKTLETVSEWVGNGQKIEVDPIIADVTDEKSLVDMCKKTKVVIDCAGPYLLYGEPVVKAAVENGASYVDFTGEELFMAKMQLKYNELAKKNKVYVVSGCGYDSIPSELGVQFLREHCPAGDRLKTIDMFIKPGGPAGGTMANHGTWDSMVGIMANQKETKEVRRELFQDRVPRVDAPSAKKMFFSKVANRWAMIFPTPDMTVSQRTQLYGFVENKEQPVRLTTYFTFKSIPEMIVMALGMAFIFLMTSFRFGARLLVDYPETFSAGRFTKEGPTREMVLKRTFQQFYEARTAAGARVIAKVSGPEMGYMTCSACTLEAALVILKEQDKLPPSGGVFTPGSAFAKTTLRQRLERHGVTYKLLEN